MTTNDHELEILAEQFRATLGRPVATVKGVAELLACHPSTIRAALYKGELRGSRRAANSPVTFSVRELARRWVAGLSRTLPVPRDGERS
jgi:hypothetical protein